MDEFVPVTKLMKGRENKAQFTSSKSLRKSKEMTAHCLLTVLDISVMSHIIESV